MQVVYNVIEITTTIDVGLLCPYENVETYIHENFNSETQNNRTKAP